MLEIEKDLIKKDKNFREVCREINFFFGKPESTLLFGGKLKNKDLDKLVKELRLLTFIPKQFHLMDTRSLSLFASPEAL